MSNNTTIPNTSPSPNTVSKVENKDDKKTWIPLSPTPQEYEKQGLEPRLLEGDYPRWRFVEQCKGVYTRKVTGIYKVRTDDDKIWLDWSETRFGKKGIGKKLDPCVIDHMGIKKVPIPKEVTEFDQEREEYYTKLISTTNHEDEYYIPFTEEALSELMHDANPYSTKFYIKHHDQQTFTVTKQEFMQKDFGKLYDTKSQRLIAK